MMLEERAASLAADLDADEGAVREDLENLVAYSVPVDEAERSLRRKYGGESTTGSPDDPKLIEAISTDDSRVSLTAMVYSAGRRPIQYEGEERVITEGELVDPTGRIGYTAWEDFDLGSGETYDITGASVREWDGEPELNLVQSTSIGASEDALDIEPPETGPRPLESLDPGARDVTVEGRIIEASERTIDGRNGSTRIREGVIADSSARLPFTDWEARDELAAEATVRIENAYVREFRGVPTLNLSRFSTVSSSGADIDPAEAVVADSIRDALEAGATYDLAIVGSIVDLRDGTGLIERCPECHRLTRQGRCRSHGDVEGEPDLRVKAVLDDGTATVTLILDTELTASIYGGSVDDAVATAREAMDQSVVTSQLRDRLLGREWEVRGQLRVDEYGGTLDATHFDPITMEGQRAAKSILEPIEVES